MAQVLTITILSLIFAYCHSFPNDSNETTGGKYVIPKKVPGQLWTPGINEQFMEMTDDEHKFFLGALPIPVPSGETSELAAPVGITLPKFYSVAITYPKCANTINTIRNQGWCSSCWAVAATAAMSDLTCIACNGSVSPYLSDADLLTCCPYCSKRDCATGGHIQRAFEYWTKDGLVTGGPFGSKGNCQPYKVPPTGNSFSLPSCSTTCEAGFPLSYRADKHKGLSYDTVSGSEMMMQAIYKYGPIVTGFQVYEDFQKYYVNDIYHHVNGPLKGGHAAKVIGWGEDTNGNKYWLAMNSWGTNWGMSGTFKIMRGNNECGFETAAVYGSASRSACFLNHHNVNDDSTMSTRTATQPSASTSKSTKHSTVPTKAAFKASVNILSLVLPVATVVALFVLQCMSPY